MFFQKKSDISEMNRSGIDAILIAISIIFAFLMGGFVFLKSFDAGIRYLTALVPLLLAITFIGTYFYNRLADMHLFSAFAVLSSIGIALQVIIDEQYTVPSSFSLLKYFVGLLIAVLFIVFYTFFRRLLRKKFTVYLMIVLAALLYIYLIYFGQDTNGYGTTAWIRIGLITLQLTDLAKITAILFYSSLFSAKDTHSNRAILILSSIFFIINLIGSALIHELGSFYILYFLHLSMLYIFMERGMKKRIYLLTIAGTTVLAIIVLFLLYKVLSPLAAAENLNTVTRFLWPIVRKIYLRFSITANINNDPFGAGYQLFQGKRALWMAGLFGNTVNFTAIPVPESDMAFIALVNSYGLPIGFLTIFLFLRIAVSGSKISRYLLDKNKQDAIVAYGATVLLYLQALLVILGSCNIIPLAGLPIPFLSRGGTYQTIVFCFAGLLLHMSQKNEHSYREGEKISDDRQQTFTRIDIEE